MLRTYVYGIEFGARTPIFWELKLEHNNFWEKTWLYEKIWAENDDNFFKAGIFCEEN